MIEVYGLQPMTDHLTEILRCPKCAKHGKGRLTETEEGDLQCQEPDCRQLYPISGGTPVMLTEDGDFLGFRRELMAARRSDNR
ncbi:MAG: hypothetical protein CMM10_04310 [Rhodospirillaceae bacterium]|nr:hypothetical protein [Rhodospirillaceae bacterium]